MCVVVGSGGRYLPIIDNGSRQNIHDGTLRINALMGRVTLVQDRVGGLMQGNSLGVDGFLDYDQISSESETLWVGGVPPSWVATRTPDRLTDISA